MNRRRPLVAAEVLAAAGVSGSAETVQAFEAAVRRLLRAGRLRPARAAVAGWTLLVLLIAAGAETDPPTAERVRSRLAVHGETVDSRPLAVSLPAASVERNRCVVDALPRAAVMTDVLDIYRVRHQLYWHDVTTDT